MNTSSSGSPGRPQPVPRPPVAVTGRQRPCVVAAGGVAVVRAGTGELAAGQPSSPSVSPVTAVGGAVSTPSLQGVKDWVISLFGTADKAALLGGMGLLIAALAALSGIVELRRRFAGVAVIAVFGRWGWWPSLAGPN